MTTNFRKSAATALSRDRRAIEGIGKYFPAGSDITIGGTRYTPATLAAEFQSEVDAILELISLRAKLGFLVTKGRKRRRSMDLLWAALRTYLLGTYGSKALGVLADFGMTAPKGMGTRTAQSKASSAAKAVATKKARRAAVAAVPSAAKK